MEVECCRKTHQRDPSQLLKDGARFVGIHGGIHVHIRFDAINGINN